MLTLDVQARFRPVSITHRRDRGVRWLVGSGLFLALALSTTHAETPVGLDAQGVNPMAAVENNQHLDVRDELGRPVSASVVLKEIHRANLKRTEQNSFTSTLPKAKIILPLIDSLEGRRSWLIQLIEYIPPVEIVTMFPPERPKISAVCLMLIGMSIVTLTTAVIPRFLQVSLSSCQRCPETLRC